jgi:hypothetical protein
MCFSMPPTTLDGSRFSVPAMALDSGRARSSLRAALTLLSR